MIHWLFRWSSAWLERATGRGVNIALRTLHLAAMGILLGGHAFDVQANRLLPTLYLTVGSGIVLGISEAGPRLLWFHQLRGLMTLAKVGLLLLVPWFWQERLLILLAVVVVGGVGSHMPARWRYYSVVHRAVVRGSCGPGMAQLDEEAAADNR